MYLEFSVESLCWDIHDMNLKSSLFLDDVYIVSFLSLKSMKNSPNSRNIFHLFELDPAPILFQKLQLQPF